MAKFSADHLARRLGLSGEAVRLAIREGKITAKKEGRSYVIRDLDLAEQQYRGLAPPPPPDTGERKQKDLKDKPLDVGSFASVLGDRYAGEELDELQSLKIWMQVKRAEVELMQATGRVIDIDVAQSQFADIVATVKTKILSVPSEFRQRVPIQDSAYAVLVELVRDALEAIAEGKIE